MMLTTNPQSRTSVYAFKQGASKIEEAHRVANQLEQVAASSDDLQFDKEVLALRQQCHALLIEAIQLIEPPIVIGR